MCDAFVAFLKAAREARKWDYLPRKRRDHRLPTVLRALFLFETFFCLLSRLIWIHVKILLGEDNAGKLLPPSSHYIWTEHTIIKSSTRIEKRVDLCDSYSLLRLSQLHDFVTGAYFAFLQDAEVESRPSAGRQQRRHPGLVHPNADAIARYARCSDLEQCTADSITVADREAGGCCGRHGTGSALS
jgi:hypothetical protein